MKNFAIIIFIGTVSVLTTFSPNIQAQQTSKTPNNPPVVSVEQKQKRQEELVKEIAKIIESKIAEAGRTLSYEEQGEFRNNAYNMMGEVYYDKGLGFDETIKYVDQNLKVPPPKETAKVGTLSIVQRLENENKAQENSQRNYVRFCDDIKDELNDLIDKYFSYHRFLDYKNPSEEMQHIDKQYANMTYCFNQGYTKQQTLEFIENKIKKSVTARINEKYLSHISKYSDKGMPVAEIIMEKYEPIRKYEKKQSYPMYPAMYRYPILDKMINETDSIISKEFFKNFMTLNSKKNSDGSKVYSDQDFSEYYNYMLEYISKNVHAPAVEKGAQPKVVDEYFSPKVYNPEITQNR